MLPNTYYRLDYIESTGTQYIDTGFKPNQDTRITLNIKTPTLTNWVVGCRSSYSNKAFCISAVNNNIDYECFFNYGFGYDHPAQVFSTTEFVEIDFNKNSLYKNGTLVISREYVQFQCDYNAFLFGANSNGLLGANACQIKSAKIYDNGTLVRDYIPVVRISDSVVGMYDLVNDTFYTNAGSGTFTGVPSHDAIQVTQNLTSYTFTEKGVYVLTGSADGGYQPTLGGTCTQMYVKQSYAGTVAVVWAEVNDTITASAGSYNQLVKITGFDKKPIVSYSAEGGSLSKNGKASDIYIGMAVGHWHGDTSVSYTFTCSGYKKDVAHSSSGWSRNAMSLMIPYTTDTVSVTVTGTATKYQGYLVQLTISGNGFIKINGEWKKATTFIKTNGEWKTAVPKIKVNGSWKGV